jgi:pimeloyl-ACP methyl ester carboxylesterase
VPLLSVLEDAEPVVAAIANIVEPVFERGGPDAALEAFLRFAYGDATLDGLAAGERARMLGNGEVAMTIELPVFQPYRPDPATLRALPVPAHVLVGREQQLPLFHEAGRWLADALGTEVESSPGAHGPQFDRPAELATFVAGVTASLPTRGGGM